MAKELARRRLLVIALVFVGQMSNGFSAQAIGPLAPLFQPDLGLSKAQVGFLSSALYAGGLVLMLVSGSITDRFGARIMTRLGQMLCGILLLALALAGDFYQAMAVMFVVGLARALISPGLSKAIMDFFSPSSRATTMGFRMSAVPLAGVLAAAALPAIAVASGWRTAIVVVGLTISVSGRGRALTGDSAETRRQGCDGPPAGRVGGC